METKRPPFGTEIHTKEDLISACSTVYKVKDGIEISEADSTIVDLPMLRRIINGIFKGAEQDGLQDKIVKKEGTLNQLGLDYAFYAEVFGLENDSSQLMASRMNLQPLNAPGDIYRPKSNWALYSAEDENLSIKADVTEIENPLTGDGLPLWLTTVYRELKELHVLPWKISFGEHGHQQFDAVMLNRFKLMDCL